MLRLAWKNLLDKPLSTGLSLLLLALGTGLISVLLLLNKQVQDNFDRNLAGVDLVIGAKGSPLQLILSSMYHIDAPTGNVSLQEVRPFLNPQHPLIAESVPLSMGDSYRGYRILGTTREWLDFYDVAVAEGALWSADFEVTIGATAAAELGLAIGDTFRSSHGLDDNQDLTHEEAPPFRVVGILAPSGTVADQLILTTPGSFWRIHDSHAEEEGDHDHDHADHDHAATDSAILDRSGLLAADPEQEITAVLARFKGRNFQALNMQRAINENTDLQAATPAIELNRLYALMDTGEQALRFLALAIMIVSALSVFVSLYASLRERRYELALLRSMGAGRGKIFGLVLLEGGLLALAGGLLGVLGAHLAFQLLAGRLEAAYRYNFRAWEFLPAEGLLVLAALGLGLLAALLPAWEAARTDIAETLTEG
jgi:putative ABC transport system permease protein